MAPLQVIDDVIVHELVHIKEKNHSKNFWNNVRIILPYYETQKKWLKENGHFTIGVSFLDLPQILHNFPHSPSTDVLKYKFLLDNCRGRRGRKYQYSLSNYLAYSMTNFLK